MAAGGDDPLGGLQVQGSKQALAVRDASSDSRYDRRQQANSNQPSSSGRGPAGPPLSLCLSGTAVPLATHGPLQPQRLTYAAGQPARDAGGDVREAGRAHQYSHHQVRRQVLQQPSSTSLLNSFQRTALLTPTQHAHHPGAALRPTSSRDLGPELLAPPMLSFQARSPAALQQQAAAVAVAAAPASPRPASSSRSRLSQALQQTSQQLRPTSAPRTRPMDSASSVHMPLLLQQQQQQRPSSKDGGTGARPAPSLTSASSNTAAELARCHLSHSKVSEQLLQPDRPGSGAPAAGLPALCARSANGLSLQPSVRQLLEACDAALGSDEGDEEEGGSSSSDDYDTNGLDAHGSSSSTGADVGAVSEQQQQQQEGGEARGSRKGRRKKTRRKKRGSQDSDPATPPGAGSKSGGLAGLGGPLASRLSPLRVIAPLVAARHSPGGLSADGRGGAEGSPLRRARPASEAALEEARRARERVAAHRAAEEARARQVAEEEARRLTAGAASAEEEVRRARERLAAHRAAEEARARQAAGEEARAAAARDVRFAEDGARKASERLAAHRQAEEERLRLVQVAEEARREQASRARRAVSQEKERRRIEIYAINALLKASDSARAALLVAAMAEKRRNKASGKHCAMTDAAATALLQQGGV